jgi:hypothetical protein
MIEFPRMPRLVPDMVTENECRLLARLGRAARVAPSPLFEFLLPRRLHGRGGRS